MKTKRRRLTKIQGMWCSTAQHMILVVSEKNRQRTKL